MAQKEITISSANPYKGVFGKVQQNHLLNRVLFGAAPKDIDAIKGKTLSQAIEILLAKSPVPAPPLNHYESVLADPTGIKVGETWVNALYGDGTVNGRRQQSLRSWWLHQMRSQGVSIEEKMILFWHNHFATELSNYNDARLGYKYQNTLRTYALGNFKDFVKAITIDPAMLRYLNGDKNTKDAPDENYSRELQELFTVGKGVDAKFTEDDVKSAAKVLTGMRIQALDATSYFQSSRHDITDKKFSAFYKNAVIKGRTGNDGVNEIDDLLNVIFNVDEVSKFIVRKLYIYFFYYEITPEIEKNFIEPLAKIFRDNKYEIKPLLQAMFSSEHFFDEALYGAIIRSPLDQIVGTLRILNAQLPANTLENIYEYYLFANDMVNTGTRGEQYLGDPPSVSGWPAYYQTPVFHEIWINSSTYPERAKFTDTLVKTGYTRNKKRLEVDLTMVVKQFAQPSDPNALINECVELLFQIPIADTLKNRLKIDILLSGQVFDYYWTDLWNEYTQKPTTNNTNMVKSRLSSLFTYLLALPEYQLI